MKIPDKRSSRLLQEAMLAHRNGRLEDARLQYQGVLKRRPDDPDALHYFGVLHHNLGRSGAGVGYIRRSLQIAPANAHAWLNLGNILLEQEQPVEARAAYERATRLAPTSANAWFNLGVCLRKLDHAAAAVTAFDESLRLQPHHAPSHYQRGIARRDAGDFSGAERDFRGGLSLQPDYTEIYESLGMLLYRQDRIVDAAAVYRDWLQHEPANSTAAHMCAAMSGDAVPARGSDAYVRDTFDRFAATFDRNLQNLGYRAPALVSDALVRLSGGAVLDAILDAGCGTGLCGELLRSHTRRLVGVDLSSGMIDVARGKGRYDELSVGELGAYMQGSPACFDAVVSADTLVYFGALEEPACAAHRCLKSGGLLVVTLEALPPDDPADFRLQPHGRYAHRIAYVETVLAAAGFGTVTIRAETLRRERGRDVEGVLITARVRGTPRNPMTR
jgi:predicted TPR repeat methyltransferase